MPTRMVGCSPRTSSACIRRASRIERRTWGNLVDGPTVTSFALHDARMLTLSESAVLLSYRAEFERPTSTAVPQMQCMYVSSLWCLRDGEWTNVFSQDTPSEHLGSGEEQAPPARDGPDRR